MSLLKCKKCGEMFSDSYKSCPFCAEDEEYYNGKVKKRNHRRMEKKQKAPSIVGPLLVLVIIIILAAAVWAIFGDTVKEWIDGRPGSEQVTPTPGGDEQTPGGEDVAPVKKLTLNKSVLMLAPGASEQLTVTGGTEGEEYVWQNSDPAVLTVSEDGKVTAVAEGSAVVTVTCGAESAVCAVTVKENVEEEDPVEGDDPTPPPVTETKVDVSKLNVTVPLYGTSLSKISDGKFDVSLSKGESFGLEITGTDVKPTWSVANSSIATVSTDGTIKGITSGETTITAKLSDVSVEIIVRVK